MTDVETQVDAVRNGMGLIDHSSTGKIAISGADRFTWLQGMVSNDVKPLAQNAFCINIEACVLDATGHILSDMSLVPVRRGARINPVFTTFAKEGEEFLLADLPRENVDKILKLFDRYIITEDVSIEDVSDSIGCLALQGKRAYDVWDFAQGADYDPFINHWNRITTYPSRHFGVLGFNAYFLMAEKHELIQAVVKSGVIEVGPEAQEVLRIEACIPRYGVDMDETTLAPEAGLMATHISLTKGCYVGQEIVARIDSRGHTNRALTGLVFDAGDAPTAGDKIVAEEEGNTRDTGRITSVVEASPAMNGRPIALGYVRHEHRTPGSRLHVVGGDRTRIAQVVESPFYRKSTHAEPSA